MYLLLYLHKNNIQTNYLKLFFRVLNLQIKKKLFWMFQKAKYLLSNCMLAI